jgi:hypothetical protein
MSRIVVDDKQISGLFMVADPHWRTKVRHGGNLLLFIPPLGWPMALGYRKELVGALRSGREPLLPEWEGRHRRLYIEGLKAMGVIFGYLSPLYLLFLGVLLSQRLFPTIEWLYGVIFFLCFPIFSTLSFPIAVAFSTFYWPSGALSPVAACLFMLAFVLIIFFIPAAFLEVSKSGAYRSAFNIRSAYGTIRDNFRGYCTAWYRSSLMSIIGHFAVPFSPWGVVWCYLGIIYEFNAVPLSAGPPFPARGSNAFMGVPLSQLCHSEVDGYGDAIPVSREHPRV